MRHKNTGHIYRIAMLAVDEANLWPIVIYSHAETGTIWSRPASEFFDGRFEVYFAPRAEAEAPAKEYVQ